MAESGLHSVSVLSDHLIRLFGACRSLRDAHDAFSRVPKPTVFTWNAIISAHTGLERYRSALSIYARMQEQGVDPNKVTFLLVLKACSSLESVFGWAIHHQILCLHGLCLEVAVANMLIHMYAKCGRLQEARNVFDGTGSESVGESVEERQLGSQTQRDSITWSALISGYTQHGFGSRALDLYDEMQAQGVQPDKSVLSSILNACGAVRAVHRGRRIHDHICRDGSLVLDAVVEGALVDMYVKCGEVCDARRVFDRLPDRDCISWSTMILGYAQQGHGSSALELFVEMRRNRIRPDPVTYLNVVKACSALKALEEGRLVHELLVRDGMEKHGVLGNAVIDMYGDCGSAFEDACRVFDGLPDPDIVSLTIVMAGYAERGEAGSLRKCLNKMEKQGIEPDGIMLMSIVSMCTHAGSMKQGCAYFKQMMMKLDGYIPVVEHYNCMVDLLARVGCVEEAESVLLTMPIPPDSVTWTSLLTSCNAFRNMDVGSRCLLHVQGMDLAEGASTYPLSRSA